ncbi:MAG: hybrid sensor histidine kinase/response regulator [Leptospiraceae bacterium]|nr:hybrid sensor histidine kinase/response regulator [Leptospiraceae bacterium]
MSLRNFPNSSVLIVDDTPKNLHLVSTILKDRVSQVYIAHNGEKALKVIEKVIPDLILLDIMMPNMDGFEVCRRLKISHKTKDIPIIFLTAKTEIEDVIKGFDLGAVDYITKPFNQQELLARVYTHLELRQLMMKQKELLHILCHDLNAPFASILSMLDIIDSYTEFQELQEDLKKVATKGYDLIQLVRKMRKMEDKNESLHLEPVNLKESLEESVLLLQQNLKKKNIELSVSVDKDHNVLAEKVSLVNSVFNNILSNSIKFSYPFSTISIQSEKKEGFIILTFIDQGIGIPEQMLKDIFDYTKTTSRIGTEGEDGTGFGMPLIKKFIHEYKGKIEIFSKEKKETSNNHGTEIRLMFQSKIF